MPIFGRPGDDRMQHVAPVAPPLTPVVGAYSSELPDLSESPSIAATTWPNVRLPGQWASIVAKIEHAFQPIANTQSGLTFGLEALMSNYRDVGFGSPEDLLEAAHNDGALVDLQHLQRVDMPGVFLAGAGIQRKGRLQVRPGPSTDSRRTI